MTAYTHKLSNIHNYELGSSTEQSGR